MKHIDKFQIYPVIELNVSDFSDKKYPYPKESSKELPYEWNAYWLKGLNDGGIKHIESIEPGSRLVRISKVSTSNLEKIINTNLKDNPEYDPEDIHPLEGGIVIATENKPIITPQCCSGIRDYKEWLDLLKSEEEGWVEVWVGHPWIFGRKKDQNIELTDFLEKNAEQLIQKDVKYSFDIALFQKKLERAVREIHSFKNQIDTILTKKCIKNHHLITEAFIYGVG